MEAFEQRQGKQMDGFARDREKPRRSRGERRGVLHSPRCCHGHEKRGSERFALRWTGEMEAASVLRVWHETRMGHGGKCPIQAPGGNAWRNLGKACWGRFPAFSLLAGVDGSGSLLREQVHSRLQRTTLTLACHKHERTGLLFARGKAWG